MPELRNWNVSQGQQQVWGRSALSLHEKLCLLTAGGAREIGLSKPFGTQKIMTKSYVSDTELQDFGTTMLDAGFA